MAEETTVEFDVEVREDRTLITITGQRDGAVIVRSEGGERIYLPPEHALGGESRDDGVYQRANDDSVYQAATDDSVYQRADAGRGRRTSTPEGIRIVHPEPTTDVRFLR